MTALPRLSDLDNRTVLGLAAKSGRPRAPSKAEKHRTCSSPRYTFAIEKRNLQL